MGVTTYIRGFLHPLVTWKGSLKHCIVKEWYNCFQHAIMDNTWKEEWDAYNPAETSTLIFHRMDVHLNQYHLNWTRYHTPHCFKDFHLSWNKALIQEHLSFEKPKKKNRLTFLKK